MGCTKLKIKNACTCIEIYKIIVMHKISILITLRVLDYSVKNHMYGYICMQTCYYNMHLLSPVYHSMHMCPHMFVDLDRYVSSMNIDMCVRTNACDLFQHIYFEIVHVCKMWGCMNPESVVPLINDTRITQPHTPRDDYCSTKTSKC